MRDEGFNVSKFMNKMLPSKLGVFGLTTNSVFLTAGPTNPQHIATNVVLEVTVVNNRFYVNVRFPSVYGPVSIQQGRLQTAPTDLDWNQSTNALEVVDDFGTPICQLYYLHPDKVIVNGLFVANGAFASFKPGYYRESDDKDID